MSEGWPAVVLQRAKYWIGIDLLSRTRQITAAIITAQIVAVRGNGASVVSDVRARRACIQDGVPNLERPVDRNTTAVVAANGTVHDGTAALNTTSGQISVVGAESAVIECHLALDAAAVTPWLAIVLAISPVAADGAAGDRQRPAGGD